MCSRVVRHGLVLTMFLRWAAVASGIPGACLTCIRGCVWAASAAYMRACTACIHTCMLQKAMCMFLVLSLCQHVLLPLL